jgi:hypothetical protein
MAGRNIREGCNDMKTRENELVTVVAVSALHLKPNEEAVASGRKVSVTREVAEALVARGDAAWPKAEEPVVNAAKPEGEALLVAIGHAMRSVDPAEGLTAEGKPSLYALARHLGYDVTGDERDAAFEMFKDKRADLFGEPDALPEKIRDKPDLIAIHRLDRTNAGLWTRDGRPDARVLTDQLKRSISGEERDALWAAYSEAVAP